MNILPKLLYVFQNIPLPPPDGLFNKLKKLLLKFIWSNQQSRVSFSLLHLPYNEGGLRCPNLKWFYWLTQLRSLRFYFCKKDISQWTEIENGNLNLSLPFCTFFLTQKKKIQKTNNPIIKNIIKVWCHVKRYIKEPICLSQLTPIWGNRDFQPERADPIFKQCSLKGLEKIQELYSPNSDYMMPFDMLRHK